MTTALASILVATVATVAIAKALGKDEDSKVALAAESAVIWLVSALVAWSCLHAVEVLRMCSR